MKKTIITIAILSSLLLVGCSDKENASPPPETNSNLSKFENNDFTITYPKNWEVLNPENFPSNVPKSTIVVIRNNIKNELFTANLNISKASVKETTTSLDFATSTLNSAQYNLINFKEISRDKVAINGEETFIARFQGRKTATENLIEFKTLCLVKNGVGILITAGYLPSEDQIVVTKLSDMIKSFTLKNP